MLQYCILKTLSFIGLVFYYSTGVYYIYIPADQNTKLDEPKTNKNTERVVLRLNDVTCIEQFHRLYLSFI